MAAGPRSALVADIGGTFARFAIADIDELRIEHFAALRCDLFPSAQATIKAYLDSVPYRPAIAGFGVAGPVSGGRASMTNLPWSFSADDLRIASGAMHVRLFNDFEALAMSLPCLGDHDLYKIGGGEPIGSSPKVVVGPGTGLGVAALVPSGSGWKALPSEGGHVTFAVEDADELALVKRIVGEGVHMSAERLLSGLGLVKLYKALAETRSLDVGSITAPEIVALAQQGNAHVAVEAFAYFQKWLGRFAGDMALVYEARGGVYLGGGIPARVFDQHETTDFQLAFFRSDFRTKGRLSEFLSSIPVYVVKALDAGLRGVAVGLAQAERADPVPVRSSSRPSVAHYSGSPANAS